MFVLYIKYHIGVTLVKESGSVTEQQKVELPTLSLSGPRERCCIFASLDSVLRFTIKTLSVLLSTPDKPIKGTAVRDIFTTFIQLMYKIFREMEDVMFPYHFPPSIPGSRRW